MTRRKRSALVKIDNLKKNGDENAAKRQKSDHVVPQQGKENQTVRVLLFLHLFMAQKFHVVVSQNATGVRELVNPGIKLNSKVPIFDRHLASKYYMACEPIQLNTAKVEIEVI
jgi:hypothetical protein